MAAHLGFVLGGFVLPLVLFLVYKDRSRFLRHHGAEALNFQITYLLAFLVTMVVFFVGIVISAATETPWGLVAVPVVLAAVIGHIVLSIQAAMRAHQGLWWRYPVNLRFVQGAVGEEEHLAPVPPG